MKLSMVALSLFAVVQVQASTLECSIKEPKSANQVERDIENASNPDTVELFETYGDAGKSVKIYANRSQTELTAKLGRGDQFTYKIKVAGRVLAQGAAKKGFITGYRAEFSNYQIDVSDTENPDVTISCQVK